MIPVYVFYMVQVDLVPLTFSIQEFHESLHSLLLWLAHAESRRYAVDVSHPDTGVRALQQHRDTLTVSRVTGLSRI